MLSVAMEADEPHGTQLNAAMDVVIAFNHVTR